MDDYYFTWSTWGMNSICVDIYEVLRPSLVCDFKFLCRHHTRFEKRAIDSLDEINIIKCGEDFMTAQFTNNGMLQIPNTRSGNHKWDNLFSLYDIGPDYGGNACNTDLSITLYKPIIKFIEYMVNSN